MMESWHPFPQTPKATLALQAQVSNDGSSLWFPSARSGVSSLGIHYNGKGKAGQEAPRFRNIRVSRVLQYVSKRSATSAKGWRQEEAAVAH